MASAPACWRALEEIAGGGQETARRITAAVSAARRAAWACGEARHGALPGVRVADKVLAGVACMRLDATVIPARSGKAGAEPNFRGFGHHPLLACCDNTGEPPAGMLRPGSAGSSTAADHLTVLAAAIAALPPQHRRRLMITCDGAGASHSLISRLDELASRRGYQVTWPAGWELGQQEKAAISEVPPQAWQLAADAVGEVQERRSGTACRERPHPGAQLTLFEAEDGWRYTLWATNLPQKTTGRRGHPACVDAAHRVHARVEDGIRTGKDTGIGHLPSQFPGHQRGLAWIVDLVYGMPKRRRERLARKRDHY